MASYKVCGALLTLCLSASASMHYGHFQAYSHSDRDVHHEPWLHGYEPYRASSSEHLPTYHAAVDHSGESTIPRSRFEEHSGESFASSATKKVPKEDKNFKKPLSSYYTITEKDSEMYKDMVLKTGLPYCEEIKRVPETVTKRSVKDSITCYKCKNPKNGATYEQCSYSSDPPKGASTMKVEDYVASPTSYRYRRSSSENDENLEGGSSGFRDRTDYRSSPYRFDEEQLADTSQDLPAGYRKKDEKCQKVVKDSMVCMVCEDTKSNGKYEQCTYVRKPNEKAYSYTKSSSFGKPREGAKEEAGDKQERGSEAPERREYKYPESRYDETKESKDYSASESPSRVYDYPGGSDKGDRRDEDGGKAKSSEYQGSRPGSSGGYSYPGEEYKSEGSSERGKEEYDSSKPVKEESREYKYPKESYESSKNSPDRDYSASKPENIEVYSEYKYPGDKYQDSGSDHGGSDSHGAEPEKSSPSEKYKAEVQEETREGAEDSGNCKSVQRDSKTCTVCKDPKTGGNYEKCSYAYQPNDKLYKFSRSKSFGYPHSAEEPEDPKYSKSPGESSEATDYKSDYTIPEASSSYYKPEEEARSRSYIEEGPKESYAGASSDERRSYKEDEPGKYSKSESEKESASMDPGNCEKVQKGSMTCTVCKSPKKGGDFEQCSYSYQPSDKLFSYTKSSSFGSPTETEGSTSYKSSVSRERPSKETRSYDESKIHDERASSSDSKKIEETPEREESKAEAKKEVLQEGGKKVEPDFFDSLKKKAEIERFLQEFQKEDRSNCKKVMRDNMTCYQCVDDKGFQKEECAFITANAPEKDRLSYREVKEYQVDPVKKVPRSVVAAKSSRHREPVALDSMGSASEHFHVKRERPEEKEEAEEKAGSKEAEAHDYGSETRSVFDKTLGLSLPAYMLAKSEGELEFDEIVASSKY